MVFAHCGTPEMPSSPTESFQVLATGLILAPAAIALQYYNPSSAVAQSSSSNQSKQSAAANTTGVGKIGNVKQLAKVLGNNSKVISNNTKIGTGKTFQTFGKEHKLTAPTPQSIEALPLHPQLLKAGNMTNPAKSGNSSSGANTTSSNNTSTGSGTNNTKK